MLGSAGLCKVDPQLLSWLRNTEAKACWSELMSFGRLAVVSEVLTTRITPSGESTPSQTLFEMHVCTFKGIPMNTYQTNTHLSLHQMSPQMEEF